MQQNQKIDTVPWEKVLSDYVRHQRAYQEQMNKIKDMNPIVWSWSDASLIPTFNPTVADTDSTDVEREKKRAQDEHKILQSIEKVAKNMVKNGNMVTADLLQRFAPPGTSPQALAMALGISETGRIPGEMSGDVLMGRYAYMQHRGMNKSWFDGMQPLRKDAPMEAHADKFGKKGGMKMRWDAAHNYKGFNLVDGPLESLSRDDQFAVNLAIKLSGGKSQTVRGGKIKVFVWLRPGQEDFYQRELSAYKQKHTGSNGQLSPEAAKHIDKVEKERAEMVAGNIKTYRHTERYSPDKVQPGTIAAKNIKMGTVESHGPPAGHDLSPDEAFEQYVSGNTKQLIPHQGQHGPTAYRMWEGEDNRMKVGRAGVGRRMGREPGTPAIQRTEPEKVEGVSLPLLWAATATPEYGMQRRESMHRDVIAPGGRMRPARSRPTSRRLTTILPDVQNEGGVQHGSHFTEGAWRQLAEDAISGRVKVVRGGRTQNIRLNEKERGNLIEAASRLAKRAGVIEDTSEFGSLNAKAKKKYLFEVVRELHKNRFKDRYGTASQREHQRQRLEARRAAEKQNTPQSSSEPSQPSEPPKPTIDWKSVASAHDGSESDQREIAERFGNIHRDISRRMKNAGPITLRAMQDYCSKMHDIHRSAQYKKQKEAIELEKNQDWDSARGAESAWNQSYEEEYEADKFEQMLYTIGSYIRKNNADEDDEVTKSMNNINEYFNARSLSKAEKMTRRDAIKKLSVVPKAAMIAAGAKMALGAIADAHDRVKREISQKLPGYPNAREMTPQQIASGIEGSAPGSTRGSLRTAKFPSIAESNKSVGDTELMRAYKEGRRGKFKKTTNDHVVGSTNMPRMSGVLGQSIVGSGRTEGVTSPELGVGLVAPSVTPISNTATRQKHSSKGPDVFKSVPNNNLSSVRSTVESMPRRPEIISTPLQRIPKEDSNRADGPSENKSTNSPAFKKLVSAVSQAKKAFDNEAKKNLDPEKPVNKLPPSNRNKFTKQAPNPDINRKIAAELRLAERASED